MYLIFKDTYTLITALALIEPLIRTYISHKLRLNIFVVFVTLMTLLTCVHDAGVLTYGRTQNIQKVLQTSKCD